MLQQAKTQDRRKRFRVHYIWGTGKGMLTLSAAGFHHAKMLARKFILNKEAEITDVESTGQSDRRYKLDERRKRVKLTP